MGASAGIAGRRQSRREDVPLFVYYRHQRDSRRRRDGDGRETSLSRLLSIVCEVNPAELMPAGPDRLGLFGGAVYRVRPRPRPPLRERPVSRPSVPCYGPEPKLTDEWSRSTFREAAKSNHFKRLVPASAHSSARERPGTAEGARRHTRAWDDDTDYIRDFDMTGVSR